MTVSISLSSQAEAALKQRAAETGKDVATLVREVVEEKLAGANDKPDALSPEQWSAQLHAWAASHSPINHPVDDSRESIYAGRGQ